MSRANKDAQREQTEEMCSGATLYYMPAGPPPSSEQTNRAIKWLKSLAGVEDAKIFRSGDNKYPEPGSTWNVPPEYSYELIEILGSTPCNQTLEDKDLGIIVVVEDIIY